jgi:glycosyltransferase involved in cell wall biosynthesis
VPQILFIHSSDELYGADRVLLEQLAALPAGVTAEVWLPDDLPHGPRPLCTRLDELGVSNRHLPLPILRRAYRTPRALLWLARRVIGLRSHLRAADPAIVYCTTSAALLAAPVARVSRVPQVFGHVHEIWRRSDTLALAGPASACHHVLAISNAVADSLPKRLRRRVTIVPNGTTDPGPPSALPGLSAAELTFVVASRWNAWKGHETLLRAWDRVDHGRLLVLGGPPPSGGSTDVCGLVARLRRPESVELVGEVDDAGEYLARADVAVVPSDEPEPFGLVTIEAFARGRPVVASAAGGALDIVTDGHDGWLFAPRDVDTLAAILARLDRDEVAGAGSAARQAFEQRYTAQRYAQAWLGAVGLRAPHRPQR